MRSARMLLLCLVPIAGCSAEEETDPGPRPEPEPRSFFVTCEDEPELGDTWELEESPSRIQVDAEGNIYLTKTGRGLACGGQELPRGFEYFSKLGPRGNTRWIRGWEQGYSEAVVAPSGDTFVAVGGDRMQLVRDDGSIAAERPWSGGWSAIAPAADGFLIADRFYPESDIGIEGVTFAPQNEWGLFVLFVGRDLSPGTIREVAANDISGPNPSAVMALDGGDTLTVHGDSTLEGYGMVITRSGATPWRHQIPWSSFELTRATPQLVDPWNNRIVIRYGTSLLCYDGEGQLLWTRDYIDALELEPNKRGGGYGVSAAAANGRVVLVHDVSETNGPIETVDGLLVPDGIDLAITLIDSESGVPTSTRLLRRAGHQSLGPIAMDRDGGLIISGFSRLPEQKHTIFVEKLRLEP